MAGEVDEHVRYSAAQGSLISALEGSLHRWLTVMKHLRTNLPPSPARRLVEDHHLRGAGRRATSAAPAE